MIDCHIHCLPGIDDGADSVETSLKMLETEKEQGVSEIIATPHYYHHRKKSIDLFLKERQQAYEKISKKSPLPILLGAEVAIEYNLSEEKNLNQLAIQGTPYILLELPYAPFHSWYLDEIYHIASHFQLKVILAHIHRYLKFYRKDEMNMILETNAIFQVNNEAFANFKEKRFVKKLIKEGYPLVFGSDAHNMDHRKPNWDIIQKKCSSDVIMQSDAIIKQQKAL